MIIQTTLTSNNARYKSTLEPALKLYKGDIVFVEITLINTIISSMLPEEPKEPEEPEEPEIPVEPTE